MSHTEFRRVLHRAGYPARKAESVLRDMPDPIDLDRDGEALFKCGVSLDVLISNVGGSP